MFARHMTGALRVVGLALVAAVVAACVHDLDRTWDGLGPRDAGGDSSPDQQQLDLGLDARFDTSLDLIADGPLDASPDIPRDAHLDAAQDAWPEVGVDTCTPPPDLGPLDLGVDLVMADGSTDASAPLAPCIDGESKTLAQCSGPCALPNDLDCDGLKAGGSYVQDMWSAQHNPLRVGDGFNDDPLVKRWSGGPDPCSYTASLAWDGSSKTVKAKGCTQMTLAPSCSAALKDPDYLTELRFTVDKILKPYDWSIYIYFGKGGFDRYCRFEQVSGVAGGDPHVQINTGNGQYQGIPSLNPAVSKIAGATFLLQGYSYKNLKTGDTWHHCRLLSGDGQQELKNVAVKGTITGAAPLKLITRNLDVTIDHVRVHEVYDQAP